MFNPTKHVSQIVYSVSIKPRAHIGRDGMGRDGFSVLSRLATSRHISSRLAPSCHILLRPDVARRDKTGRAASDGSLTYENMSHEALQNN